MPDIEAIQKSVFFVTRIGREDSAERIRSDDLMDLLLKPVVREFDESLNVVRADKLAPHGRITDKIVHHLLNSAYIIVDATGRNPNVFYELGVAHAFRRPVILIIDDPDNIPFDTKSEAHLVLPGDGSLSARAIDNAKSGLLAALKEARDSTVPPGPVAAAEAQLAPTNIPEEEANELLRNIVQNLMERVDELDLRTSSMSSTTFKQPSVSRDDPFTNYIASVLRHPGGFVEGLLDVMLVEMSATSSIDVVTWSFNDQRLQLMTRDADGNMHDNSISLADPGGLFNILAAILEVPKSPKLRSVLKEHIITAHQNKAR